MGLLTLVVVVAVFVAVSRAVHERPPERLLITIGGSIALAIVVGSITLLRRGFAALGAGGPWAMALALAHAAIAVLVLRRARTARVVVRNHPLLSERDTRTLARRHDGPMVVVLSSAALVAGIGTPASTWRSLGETAAWTLVFAVTAWLALVVTGALRFWAHTWRSRRRSFYERLDPVVWGLAQLRVAEREGAYSRLLADDLVESLRARLGRPSVRRRRRTRLSELLMAAHLFRHRMTGDRRDLDVAIDLGRTLMTSRPSRKDRERTGRSIQLASALSSAYLATGDVESLDEAIQLLRRALAVLGPGQPTTQVAESNLAVYLFERHVAVYDLPALRESIDLQRRAIAETPTESYPSALRNWVRTAVSLRSGLAARRSARAGVEPALVNAHRLPVRLSSLATALLFLEGIDDDPGLVDEAVAVARRALEVVPETHTQRPLALQGLADALLVTRDPAALDEAAQLLRQGLAEQPEDHPGRTGLLFLLGETAYRRFADTGDDAHRIEAIGHWRCASSLTTGSPEARQGSARRWGEAAGEAEDWDDAIEAYSIAVEMMARLPGRALTRVDRERTLTGSAGLVRDAAACAIAAGRPDRALELLEQGRGILFGQVLDTRSDLGQLGDRHPPLATELVRLRELLDGPPEGDRLDAIVRRHALAQGWDALLEEIREQPGFEGFLRPPAAADLLSASAAGPIVVVNVSIVRCDALVLLDGAVHTVPLPDLARDEAYERVSGYFEALVAATDPSSSLVERARAEAGVRTLLGWLRGAITGPVTALLPDDVERLWWVPTGPLTFLPLHATVGIASSYAPTIRVLEHARAQAATAELDEALVISVSETEGHAALPGAASEVATVERHFSSVRALTGPHASREGVLAALPDTPVAHFACHAYTDVSTASSGRLMLYDGPLGVTDIDGLRIGRGRLAFLSACMTAQASIDLLDETIHLTSAFQLAGYAHVIGTLWPAADTTAAAVAEAFYDNLSSGDPPHAALHKAVAALQARSPSTPSLWASYVHVGP